MKSVPPLPTANLIAKVISAWPTAATPSGRALRLWFEGALYAECALLIAWAMNSPQAGFFAVFLAAAGPTGRLERILDQNRRAIHGGALSSFRANAATSWSVLALFLGLFTAFAAAALWMGEANISAAFGYVLEVAQVGDDTILTRRFAGVVPLFLHNALVLAVFFALSFVYRVYGALLVLSWNASIWGLVIAFLVHRGVAGSAHPALFVLVSTFAVLPHLVLEAAAYVLGALAAIFLSRGVMKYGPGQPLLHAVVRASLGLCAWALGCLFLGAVVESSLPRLVLGLLRG